MIPHAFLKCLKVCDLSEACYANKALHLAGFCRASSSVTNLPYPPFIEFNISDGHQVLLNLGAHENIRLRNETTGKSLLWAAEYESWLKMMVNEWMRGNRFYYYYLDRLLNPDRPTNPYGIMNCSPHLSHQTLKHSLKDSWDRLYNFRTRHDMHESWRGTSNDEIDAMVQYLDRPVPAALVEGFHYYKEHWIEGHLNASEVLQLILERDHDVYGFFDYDAYWLPLYLRETPDERTQYEALLQMDRRSPHFGTVFIYMSGRGLYLWADSYEEWLAMVVDETIRQGGSITFDYLNSIFPDVEVFQSRLDVGCAMLESGQTLEQVALKMALPQEVFVHASKGVCNPGRSGTSMSGNRPS